mmetsp:Transcript_22546/g.46788  ORF Transcript_22546/g.46788 Transcript_22546/m.46788 type:complete len:97 (-) Transcript_22546:1584-1874(-)
MMTGLLLPSCIHGLLRECQCMGTARKMNIYAKTATVTGSNSDSLFSITILSALRLFRRRYERKAQTPAKYTTERNINVMLLSFVLAGMTSLTSTGK